MKRALIVIDGSDTALRAVHQFADLASGRPGVQAMLMHVEPPLPLLDRIVGGSPDNVLRFRQPLRDKGEKLVAPAKAELERVGVRCSIAIEFGDPAATILARAEDWRADLIVMGGDHRGAMSSLLPGSVAQKVLHHSNVPVLLVR